MLASKSTLEIDCEDYEEIEVFGGADCLHLRQAEEDTAVGGACRKAGIS
jgi:hypothetical protein